VKIRIDDRVARRKVLIQSGHSEAEMNSPKIAFGCLGVFEIVGARIARDYAITSSECRKLFLVGK
jgi:hypothetical protein